MLAIVAACMRGNDRLKICVHNRKLWAQILCRNSIMDDAGQAVQTALGRRLPWESTPDQNDVFRPALDLELTSGHSIRPGGPPVESSLSARAVLMLWDKISSSIRLRPTQVVKAPTG